MKYVSTGSKALDQLLGGGFPIGTLMCIYGDAGTGKTTLIMHAILSTYNESDPKQAFLIVDTEFGFDEDKLKKLAEARGYDPEKVWERIHEYEAESLYDQHKFITRQFEEDIQYNNLHPSLFAVDSLVQYYHQQLLEVKDSGMASLARNLQGRLALQLNTLLKLANKHRCPAIITTWIKSEASEALAESAMRSAVKAGDLSGIDFEWGLGAKDYPIIGGRRLEYQAKILLRLYKLESETDTYTALLDKHILMPSGRYIKFKITDRGLEDLPQTKVELVTEEILRIFEVEKEKLQRKIKQRKPEKEKEKNQNETPPS